MVGCGLRRSALMGGLWVGLSIAVRSGWTETLLLMSVFMLVPMGFCVADVTSPVEDHDLAWRAAWATMPVSAVAAGLSFLVDVGWPSAALTLPWLVTCVLIAVVGVRRILKRGPGPMPDLAVDAGFAFVLVGGSWLTLSRLGANPLGLGDVIVLLTAVHFHHAGWSLPILTGLTARVDGGRASTWAAAGVVAGVPLTAVGITVGGRTEWAAAVFQAVAGLAAAVALLRIVPRVGSVPAAVLIGTAGASLAIGTVLAWMWASSVLFGWDLLSIPTMAATHGSLNALGFGLAGLLGWSLWVVSDVHQGPGSGLD